jgi:hypothetical protein
MAPRANWKGYLRLSLVSCPIALMTTLSAGMRSTRGSTSKSRMRNLKPSHLRARTPSISTDSFLEKKSTKSITFARNRPRRQGRCRCLRRDPGRHRSDRQGCVGASGSDQPGAHHCPGTSGQRTNGNPSSLPIRGSRRIGFLRRYPEGPCDEGDDRDCKAHCPDQERSLPT